MNSPSNRWLLLSIAGLALAASASGLLNGFVYDDQAIIVGNANVHTLAGLAHRFAEPYWPADRGTGLYRPLTIILFALEWALGGGSPLVFHIVNVLLCAALSVAVFVLAKEVLPVPAAWIAAALFAVDPVHVEAVANGVGQAELTTALAVVVATVGYLRWRAEERLGPGRIALLVALYLVAVLSKEHGIILPALLLLAEFTVVRRSGASTLDARLRELRPTYLALTVVGTAVLGWRSHVLADIPTDIQVLSYQRLDLTGRLMTSLALVPGWLRLLFWPVHLQADYSPQETRVLTAFAPVVALSLGLLFCLALLAFRARWRVPVVTLSLGWIALSLLPVSNLLVISGQVLAERTMMLPSVGAVLLVGGLVALARERVWPAALSQVGRGAVALAVLAGLMLSAFRQPVWATDRGLRAQTVLDAPRSYWAQWMWGDWLFTHGQPAEGERHMRQAVELYNGNPFILRTLATRYQDNGYCSAAIPLYRQTLELRPAWWEVRTRLSDCLLALHREPEAAEVVEAGITQGEFVNQLREYQNRRFPVRDSLTSRPNR